jgi:regulator of nonsense transcripts 2
MKDVGPMIIAMLEEEFQYLFQKKDQINIETKIRNIRFIGELTKFKVCPANAALHFLKLCLDDFLHHNIDIACNLLETCGRFLYR